MKRKPVTGIIIITVMILFTGYFLEYYQQPLNKSVLRLHVVANSDNTEDQLLKLAVKDDIVNLMKKEFQKTSDVNMAKSQAIKLIPIIEKTAREEIRSQGYDYPVKVSVGEYAFPTKSYGNFVLPQGDYQAVKVIIGEGEGRNWWCVLFPPLCLVSSSDQGLCLDNPQEARVTLKCLELLPKGARLKLQGEE